MAMYIDKKPKAIVKYASEKRRPAWINRRPHHFMEISGTAQVIPKVMWRDEM